MPQATPRTQISVDLSQPLWEQIFTVAPLVVIGTQEADGTYDLAPKHMAMPMGWWRRSFCKTPTSAWTVPSIA